VKRNLSFLVGAFYFFYFALVGVHIIFVPKILSMLGYNAVQIGTIFASAPLVRFIVPFFFLKGFTLNQKIFYLSLLLMGSGAIGFYPSLDSFGALLGVNIIFGIGLALVLPYIEVIALEHIGKARYGQIRLFGSIGFIAVSLVLVKFLSAPENGIYFLISMALVTILFGSFLGSHQGHIAPEKLTTETLTISRFSGHIFLWIGFFLMQVSFGPFYNFFTIYVTDHGISLDTTVWLWSFGVIAEIIMFYFQGPLLQKNLLRIIWFTSIITAFRWMIVALFPDSTLLLFASQSLHAFSFALFHTSAIALLFHIYQSKRLSQQFFFGISYGLGGFIGALGAGVLYEYVPSWLFIGGSLSAALAAYAFYLQHHRSIIDDQ